MWGYGGAVAVSEYTSFTDALAVGEKTSRTDKDSG